MELPDDDTGEVVGDGDDEVAALPDGADEWDDRVCNAGVHVGDVPVPGEDSSLLPFRGPQYLHPKLFRSEKPDDPLLDRP